MENGLLKLRGELSKRTWTMLQIGGVLVFLLIWYLVTLGETPIVPKAILPKPIKVLQAYPLLFKENSLIQNMTKSIGINLVGYLEAIFLALIVGFITGLYPLFKGLFQKQIDALRYVPLTAVTGIFIAAFGLSISMKAHFLAFGIFIYLLPVVVQRIEEVESVYLKTVYTLGATNWQTIKSVYIPHVLSKLSDDIRVLTAISWTYIIIAEMLGNEGGIGALIWRVGNRQGRFDKMYALLLVIVLIGFLQDKLFSYLDRELFPHKYQTKPKYGSESDSGVSAIKAIYSFFMSTLLWIVLAGFILLLINEWTHVISDSSVLDYLFGQTKYAVIFVVLAIVGYKVNKEIKKRK